MKPTNATSCEFELVVAEHLHLLARRLASCDKGDASTSGPLREDMTEPGKGPPLSQGTQSESGPIKLDAELLENGGNLVLPCDSDLDPESWAVFLRPHGASDSGYSHFKLVGRVRSTSPLDEFIAIAYRFVLGREVDLDSLQSYRRLMETGQLLRRDFLRTLASCHESRRRKFRILVIPVPSRWLDVGGSLPNGYRRLPPRTSPEQMRRGDSEDRLGKSLMRAFPITLKFSD
jgi:hypothetical protein